MKELMNIGMFQFDIIWENPSKNMQKIEAALEGVEGQLDVLVLPEMFNTGFSMNVNKNAEKVTGSTVNWLLELSLRHKLVVIGSVIIEEDGKYHNRCLVVFPDGKISYYDKRHLFSYGKEDLSFTAGDQKLVIDVNGWKLCPLICYDLRFPVWSRNNEEYDVLLYLANWPEARALAWTSLLRARSIENLAYTIGVNRVGEDSNGLKYKGDSQCFDYEGNLMMGMKGHEALQVVQLDRGSMKYFRSKYKFYQDRDRFQILD